MRSDLPRCASSVVALGALALAACAADAGPSLREEAVVFGTDGRRQPHEASATIRDVGLLSTAQITPDDWVTRGADGTVSWFSTATHRDLLSGMGPVCEGEPFVDEPVRGRCSATLIDGDLVVTAAHCIEAAGACSRERAVSCVQMSDALFIFNNHVREDGTRPPVLWDRDVYRPVRLVARTWRRVSEAGAEELESAVSFTTGPANSREYEDFAVYQLDRPVREPYRPARVYTGAGGPNTAFELAAGTGVAIAGYPSGVQLKIDETARVVSALSPLASSPTFFTHSGDTYGGNSGGGIFDREGRFVGVHVSAEGRGGDESVFSANYDYIRDRARGCVRRRVFDEASGPYGGMGVYGHRVVSAICATGERRALCGNGEPVAPVPCRGACEGPSEPTRPRPTDMCDDVRSRLSVDGDLAVASEGLLAGGLACSNPEVGRLIMSSVDDAGAPRMVSGEGGTVAGCTATLVAPDVVLTAAHCVFHLDCASGTSDCTSTVGGGSGYRLTGDFAIGNGDVLRLTTYRVTAVTSYRASRGDAASDLALVRLDRAVPASEARAAPIATRVVDGAAVQVFGYGCDASTRDGWRLDVFRSTSRQTAAVVWGRSSSAGCNGDSGGPVLDASGAVVGILSGRVSSGGLSVDLFARPLDMRDTLAGQITAWGASLASTGTSTRPPASSCEAAVTPPAPDGGTCASGPHCESVLGQCTPVGARGYCDDGCSTSTDRCEGVVYGRPCNCVMAEGAATWSPITTEYPECAPIALEGTTPNVRRGGGCTVDEHAHRGMWGAVPLSVALLLVLRRGRRSSATKPSGS